VERALGHRVSRHRWIALNLPSSAALRERHGGMRNERNYIADGRTDALSTTGTLLHGGHSHEHAAYCHDRIY
jgi:hypothetical protein